MLKFVLILTLYGTSDNATYVMDSGMSGNDCITLLLSYAALETDVPGARLSCEIDNAG